MNDQSQFDVGEPRRVFVARGELEAQQICAFLAASGIGTLTRGETLRHTHGLTLDGLGQVEIFVAEADADQARALLDSAESGELRLGDEEDGGGSDA